MIALQFLLQVDYVHGAGVALLRCRLQTVSALSVWND
jgi:hypothetical protein